MNQRLEQYLSEAEQKLQALPPLRRQQELDEVRQHLTASVQAQEEAGFSTDAATEAAVKQFGEARHVGSSLQRVWWREQFSGPHGVLKTALLACVLRTGFCLLMAPITANIIQHAAVSIFLGFLLPSVATGVVLGRLSPRNAVPGVLLCSLVFYLTAMIAPQIFMIVYNESLPRNPWWVTSRDPLIIITMVGAAWLTARQGQKQLHTAR